MEQREEEKEAHLEKLAPLKGWPWVEQLPPKHPRWRIRNFLHHLFGVLGEPLSDAWPAVSAQEFGACMGILRKRLQPLYDYTETQAAWSMERRFMARYLGDTACYLMRLDWSQPDAVHDGDEAIRALLSDRPRAITDYDQLYCSVDTAVRRAQRVRESFDDPHCKVLMLGDDDLISVVLAQSFQGDIHMVDLDDRLHEYIAEKAPRVQRHKADFIGGGLPMELFGAFDAVMLDPPWNHYRLWCFIEKAMFALKETTDARIYLSYCPLILEYHDQKIDRLLSRLASFGFTFARIETAFNLYDLSPDDLPDFPQRLAPHIPPVESPLLDILCRIPYAHTQLYALRRLPYERPNWLRRKLFTWWNRA